MAVLRARGGDGDVSDPALDRVTHGAVSDQGMGEFEDLVCHRAAFGSIAVQQCVRGPACRDQGEFPA
jgi:hypothetical protein